MKRQLFIAALLLACHTGRAQIGYNQTASGESAIMFRGSNIGLNISDASLSFGINNLDRQFAKKRAMIAGASASGANAEGLTGIFAAGEFVPESKLEGFWGISFSNAQSLLSRIEAVDAPSNAARQNEQREFLTHLTEQFRRTVIREAVMSPESKRSRFIRTVIDTFNLQENKKTYIFSLTSADQEESDAIFRIQQSMDSLFIAHDERMARIAQRKAANWERSFSRASFTNLSIFLLGGINGSEFKRFLGEDTTDYSKSFKTESFRGGYFGAGVNFQSGNFYFGATYAYKATNNFDLLTKKEYSWKKLSTSGNQSLSQEKKITAYADEYAEIEVNELSVDIAYNFSLDTVKHQYHLFVNPYLRAMMQSRKSTLMPDKATIGTGVYFFDETSKFLGGLYVELGDVANNYEKMKPADEQNLRKGWKRLNFGITTKFSFTTLRNTFIPKKKES